MAAQRIGIGYDIHRLTAGEALALGGLTIACPFRAVAHSDGDVVLHALIDAILGALALGDIGSWFPDTDPAHADRPSSTFLATVLADERVAGWRLVNCDCNIIAQQPKIGPHREAMRQRLADLLDVGLDQVSIKARTNEGCDAIGRVEAIAAQVVVLLERD